MTVVGEINTPPLPLGYTWLQTGGPAVTLDNNAFARPTFTAPTVAAASPAVTLTFSLVVTNGFSCRANSTDCSMSQPSSVQSVDEMRTKSG